MRDILKPCPFCGFDPEISMWPLWHTFPDGITHGYFGEWEYSVKCVNEDCKINPATKGYNTMQYSKEECQKRAIDDWNERRKA